ncbi:MAG: TfoX/Sxy family protein [Myxococcota bacterium]
MAYDQALARRIRRRIGEHPDVTEKHMFGGLAFLVRGNMAVAASHTGQMLLRFDKSQHRIVVAHPEVAPMKMGRRKMTGWAYLSPGGCRDESLFQNWVDRCFVYAQALPPKRPRR